MYLRYSLIRAVKDPARANYGDAGLDFFVPEDFNAVQVDPGDNINIPSGVKIEVPVGWALIMFNKSGIASKRGLLIGACVVDHGYTGEVHINVINASNTPTIVEPGTKLAQGLMIQVGTFVPLLTDVDSLYSGHPRIGSRADGGFGSTGA